MLSVQIFHARDEGGGVKVDTLYALSSLLPLQHDDNNDDHDDVVRM